MSEHPPLRLVSPRGRLVALGVACLVATGLGVAIVLLNLENMNSLLLGVGVIGLFGIGGGFSLAGQFRRSTVLRADDDGIHVTGVGTVPWKDVDRIGATGGALGIRLRSPDALLRTAPKDVTRESLRQNRGPSGGFDLSWPEDRIGRSATEAASLLRAREP